MCKKYLLNKIKILDNQIYKISTNKKSIRKSVIDYDQKIKKSIFFHGMFSLLAICLYSFIGLVPPVRTKENLFFSLFLIFALNNLINFLIKKFSLLW